MPLELGSREFNCGDSSQDLMSLRSQLHLPVISRCYLTGERKYLCILVHNKLQETEKKKKLFFLSEELKVGHVEAAAVRRLCTSRRGEQTDDARNGHAVDGTAALDRRRLRVAQTTTRRVILRSGGGRYFIYRPPPGYPKAVRSLPNVRDSASGTRYDTNESYLPLPGSNTQATLPDTDATAEARRGRPGSGSRVAADIADADG
ncbi:unnamed protein product [Urochloa humidicola]